MEKLTFQRDCAKASTFKGLYQMEYNDIKALWKISWSTNCKDTVCNGYSGINITSTIKTSNNSISSVLVSNYGMDQKISFKQWKKKKRKKKTEKLDI